MVARLVSAAATASFAVKTIAPLAAPGDAATPRAIVVYGTSGSNVGWRRASSVPASIVAIACLGPVTHTGCGALCPGYDRGCYGCFGPMETPNTLGADGRDIVRVHRTFNANAPAFRKESEAHEPG